MVITRAKIAISEGKNANKDTFMRLYDVYRIRIVPSIEFPLFEDSKWFCEKIPEIMLIDIPPEEKTKEELEAGLKCDGQEDMDYEDDGDPDGPLQISFLTLDKLNQGQNFKELSSLTPDMLYSRAGGAVKIFETIPVPLKAALSIRNRLQFDAKTLFEPTLAQMPFFVLTEYDPLHHCLVGIQKERKALNYHVSRAMGPVDCFSLQKLHALRARFVLCTSKSQATSHYEVIGPLNKKKGGVIGGRLSIKFTFPVGVRSVLENPPPDAKGVFRFAPGWRDERVALNTTGIELDYLMNMVDALKSGDLSRLKWRAATPSNTDEKIIESVNKVIEFCRGVSGKEIDKAGETRYLDMTEQLWFVLRACSSYDQLVLGLRKIFNMFTTGTANAVVHDDNRSMLARLVRDANSGDLMLPRLEALTPIQILAEIAAEKIKRDLSYTFVHQGFLTDESQLAAFIFCNVKATAPVEDRAQCLIPIHLALQTMVEVNKHLKMDNFRLANMTKSVLLQYTRHPADKMKEVDFVTEIKKVEVNPDVMDNIRPSVWINETWYDHGGKSHAYTMAHFALQSRFEQMEKLIIKAEEHEELLREGGPDPKRFKLDDDKLEISRGYVCTLTTTTFHDMEFLLGWK